MLEPKKDTDDNIYVRKIQLERREFYDIWKLLETQTNEVVYHMYEFNQQKMKKLGMENSIAKNRIIFNMSRCRELEPGWNVHYIKRERENQFFVEPYQCRLDQYARKDHGLTEQESISCLRQIINAIYSLHHQKYACLNLRAENFVLVETQKRENPSNKKTVLIKINSVPFKSKIQQKQFDSPFVWRKKYQSPEHYKKDELSPEELEQSIVWNIGCIWLELLYGRHLLDTPEIIDQFCIGNTEGVFNFDVFKLKNKLSNQFYELLKKLLAYQSNRRIPLKQVFNHHILGQQIILLTKQKKDNNNSSTVSQNSPFLIRSDQSDSDEVTPYDTLVKFALKMVNIVKQTEDFLPLIEEKMAYRQLSQIQRNNQINKLFIEGDRSTSPFSPKNTKASKFSQGKVRKNLTAQNILDYLRPYKFYYDKTIFLSNCFSQVKTNLKVQISNSQPNQLDPEMLRAGHTEDLLFKFEFAIIYLRLIYLKYLETSLVIHQNVFNIPNNVYNIKNSDFENTSPEWQLFQETALFNALLQFFRTQFSKLSNKFDEMINRYGSTSKLSKNCSSQILKICKYKPFKTCPIQQFIGQYQKFLKEVLYKVDHNSHMINGLRIPIQDMKKKKQSTINAAYLEISLFVQSQKLFHPDNREKLFYKFMRTSINKIQSNFLEVHRSSLQSRQQKIISFCEQNSEEYFDFEAYEQFLKHGNYENLSNQVSHLFSKFKV